MQHVSMKVKITANVSALVVKESLSFEVESCMETFCFNFISKEAAS